MRFLCLVCVLLAVTYGQNPPDAPPASRAKTEQSASAVPEKAPEVKVGPDDPVITVKGFCADAAQQGDACRTVITRAQFEEIARVSQTGKSPTLRRKLATDYARFLQMSAAAERRGLEKDPTVEAQMNFARIQILSQGLGRSLLEDASKVSEADIEDYYKQNETSYEQATFERILVPGAKQIVGPAASPTAGAKADVSANPTQPPTAEQRKAAAQTMTKVAASLRARAAQGEDFDKLQKEAYAEAGLPNPPSTRWENVLRSSLSATQQGIMDLKPGGVSEVITESGASYIYKLVTKETMSLETVKPQIRNLISNQRFRDSIQNFQGNVDLNDAYFGPPRNSSGTE